MWTDEYIFSKGDLSKGVEGENYSFIIEQYFNGDLIERYNHVCKMIERLTAEKEMLSDKLPF